MPLARELRDIARDLGLRGYSKMNKTALTDAIEGNVQHGKAVRMLIVMMNLLLLLFLPNLHLNKKDHLHHHGYSFAGNTQRNKVYHTKQQ